MPARYGEKGYGEHEYVYNGRSENEENGYGHGGNSQEVKLMKQDNLSPGLEPHHLEYK